MRSSTRNVLTLGALALTGLIWSGCDAKKQTEYVAGVSTQVQVPRDLQSIRIDVSVGGVVLFCRGYKVYDGRVQLPRSLGEFPQTGSPGPDPITVTVTGFTETFSETDGKDVFANCTSVAPVVDPTNANGQGARILRRSRQPYVQDSVLFLPMALKYSCFDKSCPDEGQTCKGGVCVDAKIDETKLPKFSDDLIDGTGGACFSASNCFKAAVPVVPVDPDNCVYALPNTPSAPAEVMGAPPNPVMSAGDGINVEVAFDGGYNTEILDKDPQEGFIVPDPTKPQRFQLARGLCDLVQGTDSVTHTDTLHRITQIRATGLCQAKSPFQPLCANDLLAAMGAPDGISVTADAPVDCTAIPLNPALSALMVLVDDTANHDIFFNTEEADQIRMGLQTALKDPAFGNTDIGLTFFPGPAVACAGFTTTVPFVKARQASDVVFGPTGTIEAEKTMLKPANADVQLGAAIAYASTQLTTAKYANANRRAILVIGNRGFDDASTTCGPTAKNAAAAAKTAGVDTYVTLLARDPSVPGSTAMAPLPVDVPNANVVALAGSPGTENLGAYDARSLSNKPKAQSAVQQIVNDLATCALDATAVLGATDMLSYSDPVPNSAKQFYIIPPTANCTTGEGTGNGWGADAANPKRIHICGQACTDYRNVLAKSSVYDLPYTQPAFAVPVFAHKSPCAPKP